MGLGVIRARLQRDFEMRDRIIVVCLVAGIVLVVFGLLLLLKPPRSQLEYIGVLESIEYDRGPHFGWTTWLKFEDGKVFSLGGYWVYEIGETYRIVFDEDGEILSVNRES